MVAQAPRYGNLTCSPNSDSQPHCLYKMMALADSLVAYTAHCDQLAELGPFVERVANKHVSLGVVPEQYPVVGVTLLGALEVIQHLTEQYRLSSN